MPKPTLPSATLLVILCLLATGCEPRVSEELLAARKQFLLAEEPAEIQTVLDLNELEGGFTEGDVVLVGSVGGMPNPFQDTEADFPWRKGQASFFLVDPSTVAEFGDHEHAAGEDHSDCIYCQSKAADSAASVVAVTFTDASGQTVAFDAQKLFELKEKDTVVVRGHAQRLGEGLLVVDAVGIYVRR